MRIQTWGCVFVLAVAMASAFGAKVDSTYLQPITAERSYSTAVNWLNMKPASGGGTLSFVNQTASCKANFKLDAKEDVVLGGVDFGPGGFRISGNTLTLSGDGVIRSDNTVGTGFSNHLIIPEGSTMTKRGKGKVTIEYGFSGAGKLVVAEGTVVSADGEHFMAEGDIDIRTGHVSWYEPRTTGDVSLGCGNVSYGPDRAKIVVTKGKVTSYVATMKSLGIVAKLGMESCV